MSQCNPIDAEAMESGSAKMAAICSEWICEDSEDNNMEADSTLESLKDHQGRYMETYGDIHHHSSSFIRVDFRDTGIFFINCVKLGAVSMNCTTPCDMEMP